MEDKDIVYKVLWSTIEDFVGLWEVLWEINSLFPEKKQKDNQVLTKNALCYLLERELIIFYKSSWGKDDLVELKFSEANSIFDDVKYWEAPTLNEVCVKIGSTEKGEQFYNDYEIPVYPSPTANPT